MRFNNGVSPVLWFDTFNTKSEIVAAITAIGYSGSGTETGKALEYTANYVLNPMYGARAGTDSKNKEARLIGLSGMLGDRQ